MNSEIGSETDESDLSVMRSELQFKVIFEAAGLQIVKHQYQKDMPEELHKISTYALRKSNKLQWIIDY